MNKKNIFTTTIMMALLAGIVAFQSCQKEGKYNPEQKISKIYEDVYEYVSFWNEEMETWDERQEVKYPKQLTEEWIWKDDKLSEINYYWYIYYNNDIMMFLSTDYYFYKNGRLDKIEHDEESDYTKITYNGSKYDKFEHFSDDILWFSAEFSYENDKISKIVVEQKHIPIYGVPKRDPLSSFIPKEFISIMNDDLKKNEKGAKWEETSRKQTVYYTYNGDNIKEMKVEIDRFYGYEIFETRTWVFNYLSYDNKQNPFYKKTDMNFWEIDYYNVNYVTSKNNPLEVSIEFQRSPDIIYSYKYENDFPVEVEEKQDTYTFKTYYEYK